LPEPAARWFDGLIEAIRSLSVNTERCPVTAEDSEYRHLLYGRTPNVYRIVFRKLPKRVIVAHIRHGAQQPFTAADLN
jgi:toxin ParE1/3/4